MGHLGEIHRGHRGRQSRFQLDPFEPDGRKRGSAYPRWWLVAGAALGAFANLVSADPRRPPRLVLLLGGFFVLTVGGMGLRGATALLGGDVLTGLRNLADFGMQVPTVALAIAVGVLATEHWSRAHETRYSRGRTP